MITPAWTDVIHWDEQCRDGHYRAKQDLRQQTRRATGTITRQVWIRMMPLRSRRKTLHAWQAEGRGGLRRGCRYSGDLEHHALRHW